MEAAVQAQAHLIVQLKDNQPTLLQQTQAACTARAPLDANTTITEGRSRHETRTTEVFKPTKAGIGTEWQPLVKQIVRVSRNVLHRSARTGLWTSTSEVAYYLANTEASASRFAAAIRAIAHPGCSRPMLDGGAASTLRRSSRMERRLALAVLTTERNAA